MQNNSDGHGVGVGANGDVYLDNHGVQRNNTGFSRQLSNDQVLKGGGSYNHVRCVV